MEIRNITINREEYGPNKGKFEAKITMKGGSLYPADVTLAVPDEILQPIVDIVTQATVHVMQQSAAEFTSAVAAQLAGPAIEAEQIAAPVAE